MSSIKSSESIKTKTSASDKFLPVVVPQTYSQWSSPFVRAYAESLADYDISADRWLAFVDGLNRVTTRSSTATVVTIVGGIVSSTPFPPAIAAGTVALVLSEGADITRSKMMSKRYLKKANDDIFFPRGLSCKIFETKTCLKELDIPQADGIHPDELIEQAQVDADQKAPRNPAARLEKAFRPFGGHIAPLVYFDDPVLKKNMQGLVGRADRFIAKSQSRLVNRNQRRSARKLLNAHSKISEKKGAEKTMQKRLRKYAASTGHTVQGVKPPEKDNGVMQRMGRVLLSTQWLVVEPLKGHLPSANSLLIEVDEAGNRLDQMSLSSTESIAIPPPSYPKEEVAV